MTLGNAFLLILVIGICYGLWILIAKPMIEQAIDTHKKLSNFKNGLTNY